MKTSILLTLFISSLCYANQSAVSSGYPLALYDENMRKEFVVGKAQSQRDYQGITYSEVVVIGKLYHEKPRVHIGNSIGHYVSQKPFFKNKKLIGKIFLFKHYSVKQGYLKLFTAKKVLHMRLFVQ